MINLRRALYDRNYSRVLYREYQISYWGAQIMVKWDHLRKSIGKSQSYILSVGVNHVNILAELPPIFKVVPALFLCVFKDFLSYF